jgi:hypothetical protein
MFLFAGLGGTDLGRMPHSALDAQLFQQLQEPLHRAAGFHADHHWTFQRGVKLSYRIPLVPKPLLHKFTSFAIHHGYALLPCM